MAWEEETLRQLVADLHKGHRLNRELYDIVGDLRDELILGRVATGKLTDAVLDLVSEIRYQRKGGEPPVPRTVTVEIPPSSASSSDSEH